MSRSTEDIRTEDAQLRSIALEGRDESRDISRAGHALILREALAWAESRNDAVSAARLREALERLADGD